MANIKIELGQPIIDGMPLSFRAPCNCNEVTGIKVKWHDGDEAYFIVFSFADSHGNDLTGLGNLFSTGVMVRVVLDVPNAKAFIQNADTNTYLEEQLKRKAPSGYGLGKAKLITAAAIGSTTTPGWYYINEEMTIGGITVSYWYMHVVAYSDGSKHCMQYLYPVRLDGGMTVLRRMSHSAVWQEWEYENPPMIEGHEYRTTERYDNYPVYTQLLRLGYFEYGNTNGSIGGNSMPSIGGTSANYKIQEIVRVSACFKKGVNSTILPTQHTNFYIRSNNGVLDYTVSMTDSADAGKALLVQIWYTKY